MTGNQLNLEETETDDLRSQLHSMRLQNAILEEQLRHSQQDMARWRFESLKSRCILIDREHLLTENKISFKPIWAMEYNISQKEQQEAKPRIVNKRRSSTFRNMIDCKSMTPPKMPPEQLEIESNLKNPIKNNSISLISIMKSENNQNNVCLDVNASEAEVQIPEKVSVEEESKLDENVKKQENQNKENNSPDNSPRLFSISKLKATLLSPMRPSQRSLIKSITKTND